MTGMILNILKTIPHFKWMRGKVCQLYIYIFFNWRIIMLIKPVNPKGNQPWTFIGRTDAGLKLQYLGHLMRWADSLEKTLMLGKTEGRRRRGQQRMKWLDGIINSMEQNVGDSEGQGSLACCSPWGHSKESDMTEQLNSNSCVHFKCRAKWFHDTHIYLLFFRVFSLIGYYKILSIVLCATQEVLVGYRFYT